MLVEEYIGVIPSIISQQLFHRPERISRFCADGAGGITEPGPAEGGIIEERTDPCNIHKVTDDTVDRFWREGVIRDYGRDVERGAVGWAEGCVVGGEEGGWGAVGDDWEGRDGIGVVGGWDGV